MTASGEPNSKRRAPLPGAYRALLLLLGINLFNYIDRQILAAVEPSIFETFFSHRSASAMALTGTLGSAFLVSYMLSAPALGWLADRFSRWVIVGCAVIFWSVASGASGLAATFGLLMATRVFVGIGEGGYGPAAPTILADLFPVQTRGRVLAVFCSAIPVGSALGYVIGGIVNTHLGWRWAFYLVTPPGVLLGALCFLQKDPRASGLAVPQRQRARLANYIELFRTRSYVLNTLAQTTMTFAFGGLGFWVAEYLKFRGLPPTATATFGAITAGAGLISTLVGGVIGDRLRTRVPGSYFLVSGTGMILAFPIFTAMLFTPFPAAWFLLFGTIFFGFLNTGPSNTALANVSSPRVRATAFALNILIIHTLGDVAAFPTIGFIAGYASITVAFLVVSGMMLLSGLFWLAGMKYLPGDTAAVESATTGS